MAVAGWAGCRLPLNFDAGAPPPWTVATGFAHSQSHGVARGISRLAGRRQRPADGVHPVARAPVAIHEVHASSVHGLIADVFRREAEDLPFDPEAESTPYPAVENLCGACCALASVR